MKKIKWSRIIGREKGYKYKGKRLDDREKVFKMRYIHCL